jgi:hypothetical protein
MNERIVAKDFLLSGLLEAKANPKFAQKCKSTHKKRHERILEQEAKETGVPVSNLVSYIVANYVREEKNKRGSQNWVSLTLITELSSSEIFYQLSMIFALFWC